MTVVIFVSLFPVVPATPSKLPQEDVDQAPGFRPNTLICVPDHYEGVSCFRQYFVRAIDIEDNSQLGLHAVPLKPDGQPQNIEPKFFSYDLDLSTAFTWEPMDNTGLLKPDDKVYWLSAERLVFVGVFQELLKTNRRIAVLKDPKGKNQVRSFAC